MLIKPPGSDRSALVSQVVTGLIVACVGTGTTAKLLHRRAVIDGHPVSSAVFFITAAFLIAVLMLQVWFF